MQGKKKTFLALKKQNFSKPKKSAFPKGLAYAFRQKMPFFLYLDLVNIRLEIMVNYFEETKETFLTIKKQNISKSKRSHFFQTGRTYAFGFIRFDQNNTWNNAFWLCREKRTLFRPWKTAFSKSKNANFFLIWISSK